MLLKSILTHGKQTVELSRVTVLVGPQNSGKSSILRDIFRLLTNCEPRLSTGELDAARAPRILTELQLVTSLNHELLLRGISPARSAKEEISTLQGLGPLLRAPHRATLRRDAWRVLNRPALTAEAIRQSDLIHLMPLRLVYSTSSERSTLVNSAPACSPIAPPSSLLQLLEFAPPAVHLALDAALAAAFPGLKVRLDSSERVQLTLRCGDEFPAEPVNPVEAVAFYQEFSPLDEQGEGLRDYVALVLALLLTEGRLLLLDHPETNLHPSQARLLGEWLAKTARSVGSQIVAATHSAAFVEGVVAGDADSRVLRVQRNGPSVRLQTAPPALSSALVRAPQVAGQQALDALFQRGVVIVRTEADRIVYQAVCRLACGEESVKFLQCRGKGSTSKLLSLLRAGQVPAVVISDFSALASAVSFTELVTVATGEPPPRGWIRIRHNLAQFIEGKLEEQVMTPSAQEVEDFLDQLKKSDGEPSAEMSTIPRHIRAERWMKFNQDGIGVLPREMRLWVEEMFDELKRFGLFICPKGDVCGWLDLPIPRDLRDEWLVEAVMEITEGKSPMELKVFVAEVLQGLQTPLPASRPASASHSA